MSNLQYWPVGPSEDLPGRRQTLNKLLRCPSLLIAPLPNCWLSRFHVFLVNSSSELSAPVSQAVSEAIRKVMELVDA